MAKTLLPTFAVIGSFSVMPFSSTVVFITAVEFGGAVFHLCQRWLWSVCRRHEHVPPCTRKRFSGSHASTNKSRGNIFVPACPSVRGRSRLIPRDASAGTSSSLEGEDGVNASTLPCDLAHIIAGHRIRLRGRYRPSVPGTHTRDKAARIDIFDPFRHRPERHLVNNVLYSCGSVVPTQHTAPIALSHVDKAAHPKDDDKDWTVCVAAWKRLGMMLRWSQIKRLQHTFRYLFAWFLLSDGQPNHLFSISFQ